MSVKLVKKLTTKHMFGGSKGVLALFPGNAKDGDALPLCDIAGIAKKVRRDESTMGEFAELQGDFAGILPDGTRYQSSKCFIPDGAAHDATVEAVENADGHEIEFAFRISVVRDSTSASGYTYASEALTEVKPSDRMAALMQSANIGGAALTDQSGGEKEKPKK